LNVTNRSLIKTFFVQRALNFLVITNIPNFHMLDSVIRLHRCRTLIEVISRGRYKCITGRGIGIVAKEGQQFKEVTGVKLPEGLWWHGQFSIDFPAVINRQEYENHKLLSIKTMLSEMKDDVLERRMVSAGKVAKEIGSTSDTIIKLIKKQEIEGKQIGNKWYITRKAHDKLMTV
ncbi:hypothetical protein LCGC14_2878490, partial [marine sediment metagenome]